MFVEPTQSQSQPQPQFASTGFPLIANPKLDAFIPLSAGTRTLVWWMPHVKLKPDFTPRSVDLPVVLPEDLYKVYRSTQSKLSNKMRVSTTIMAKGLLVNAMNISKVLELVQSPTLYTAEDIATKLCIECEYRVCRLSLYRLTGSAKEVPPTINLDVVSYDPIDYDMMGPNIPQFIKHGINPKPQLAPPEQHNHITLQQREVFKRMISESNHKV